MKLSTGEVLGCDISYHQGAVNFKTLKNSGLEFVILRAGYGTTVDKRFITYINDAISAGLHIGIYWFIYAANETVAKQNAEKCDSVIKAYKDKIDMGVWADFEYDSDKKAGYKLNVTQRSAIVEKFLSTMSSKGYDVGNYTNPDYINSKFSSELCAKYPCWLARYSKSYGNMPKIKDKKPYIWQYTSKEPGKKHGVSSTYLDMDIAYMDIPKIKNGTSIVEQVTTSNNVKASDNPYIEPKRNIYYKEKGMMRGDDVKWVQWHLWRFGLIKKNEIDGWFGLKSKQATGKLQALLKVSKDYNVGPKTRAAVKNI